MRIVHFSDWHGETSLLPKADLYVCSGDMYPNFPLVLFGTKLVPWRANMHLLGEGTRCPEGLNVHRQIDPDIEAELQGRWVREVLGSYRKLFASPDAPVVCVRGNHDFRLLSDAFGGDVWEVGLDPTLTVEKLGMKVGGCRGIPYIIGEWSDELSEREKFPEGTPVRPPVGRFEDVARQVPAGVELLVTHAPPYGVLDSFRQTSYGSRSLRSYIDERMYAGGKLRAHLFGHIHEARGSRSEGGVLFGNAARSFSVYDI